MRILISLCFLPALAFAVQEYEYVRLPASRLNESFQKENGFIRDHKYSKTFAFGYLPKGSPALRENEDKSGITKLDTWEWARHDHDTETLKRLPEPKPSADIYEDFHTYDTLTNEVQALAKDFPNLVTLESAGKSVEGRDLWLLRLTSHKLADPNKPKLLYISSMHGDEVTGKEMLIYLARELLNQYGKDPRLTTLMDNAEIFLMPSMNPDGTERRQRWNANGADLNRNFPEMSEEAFSLNGREVETKALMELHRNHRFLVSLNFHGGSLCVNLPWDHKQNSGSGIFGDDRLISTLGKEYARANKPMGNANFGTFVNGVTYGYEWYQVLGGMQDWSSYFRDSNHATLEISNTKWPSGNQLPQFWSENRESLIKYLEGGLVGLHLKVTDSSGKPIADVSVDVGTATRTLKYASVVHRTSVAGDQQVTLKSPGYRTKTLTLPAEAFHGEYRLVTLESQMRVSERAGSTRKKSP